MELFGLLNLLNSLLPQTPQTEAPTEPTPPVQTEEPPPQAEPQANACVDFFNRHDSRAKRKNTSK